MTSRDISPDTLLGGKIRLIKRIGRGGMGDVWIARNEATQAELAVKTLHRPQRSRVNDERFRREARLSATVSHRNVVRVFDLVDEADGTLGLVMELLRGGTLEECMKERATLTNLQALSVAIPVLSAMHHVHQKGIVHRDVKPSNVFFAVEPDGHVIPKILDFGIAKLPAAGSALTVDGNVLGTPHYMSPEQIRGQEDIDGKSDMFAFAVVLYEMLTGVRVFERESASASLAAVLEHEVDPDPRIEPRLWLALSRALAKRPYERFTSCAEFADALRASIDVSDDELAQAVQELRPRSESGSSISSTPSNLVAPSEGPRHQRPRWAKAKTTALVVGVAMAAATFAAAVTLMWTRSPSAPASAAPSPPSTELDAARAAPWATTTPSASAVATPSESAQTTAPPSRQESLPLPMKRSSPSPSPPSPAEKKSSKPRGPAGGVATTPGF